MNKTRTKTVLQILRIGFSVGLVVFLLWWVSPGKLADALTNITLPLIAYLLLISFVLIYVSVLKWKVLLEAQGGEESSVRLYGLYLVGYFINLLFPSFVGGDAIRSWYLGKRHGQREAAAATFLERYSGLAAMIALACLFMWATSYITLSVRVTILVIAVLFLAASVFLLSQTAVRAVSVVPVVGEKFAKQGALFQSAVRLVLRSRRTLIAVSVYSLLFHCLAVVNVFACAYAVGWYGVPISDLFVVLPVILLLAALPLTPQGIGIQEGAFVYYLTLLGATSAEALGIALIIRAKAYILAVFGGVYWLREGRKAGIQEGIEQLAGSEGPAPVK